jgi:hypothetical protein
MAWCTLIEQIDDANLAVFRIHHLQTAYGARFENSSSKGYVSRANGMRRNSSTSARVSLRNEWQLAKIDRGKTRRDPREAVRVGRQAIEAKGGYI